VKYVGELTAEPGVCRFCRCSEDSPCSWHRKEGVTWVTARQNCCTAPQCINARSREINARMAMEKEWKRKKTPGEISELIKEEKREKQRKYRAKVKARKQKGRAA
jgi:hypothetical protein